MGKTAAPRIVGGFWAKPSSILNAQFTNVKKHMNRVMNHIASNLYSAFVANLSNKSDTVMLFGIFHKPSASSLGFVSGILPCLGESSSRPLFPVPSAGTETSTTTPARTSQRCQPLLLPLFSQRQAKPDCLGSAHIIFPLRFQKCVGALAHYTRLRHCL